MGQIINQNSDANAQDNWAIVDNGTVSNLVTANLGFIQGIQSQHDFLVDITVGGQSPVDIGYSYDSNANTFAAPAVDHVALLRADLNATISSAIQAITDSQYASDADIDAAFVLVGEDSASSLTGNALFLWAVYKVLVKNRGA